MTRLRALQLGVVTLLSAWLSWRAHTGPDYFIDGGPPIDALVNGHLHEFLSSRPAMGPFSLIFRAPFAALAHITGNGGPSSGYDAEYRFGAFPCLMAAGVLGMVLAEYLRRRGRSVVEQWLVLVLCVINPVSSRALALGHPEEILGAVFLAAGLLAALADRIRWMVVFLALGLLTKQWALFALLPAAVVIGWQRLKRPLLIGAAVCVAVALPIFLTDPSSLIHANTGQLDIKNEHVQPASIWWPFTEPVQIPGRQGYHALPHVLRVGARPLILALGLILPLLFARRVRLDPLRRALPLLALVLLTRCFLDPVNNGYYHVPFFIALAAADARGGTMLPTVVAAIGLEAVTQSVKLGAGAVCAVYLLWALPFAVYLAGRCYGYDWMALVRSRGARDPAAAPAQRPTSSAARS